MAWRQRILTMSFALCAGIYRFEFLATGFENLIFRNTI